MLSRTIHSRTKGRWRERPNNTPTEYPLSVFADEKQLQMFSSCVFGSISLYSLLNPGTNHNESVVAAQRCYITNTLTEPTLTLRISMQKATPSSEVATQCHLPLEPR